MFVFNLNFNLVSVKINLIVKKFKKLYNFKVYLYVAI